MSRGGGHSGGSSSHGGGSSHMHSSSGGHSRGYSSSSSTRSSHTSRASHGGSRSGWRGRPYTRTYYRHGVPYTRTVYTRPLGCVSVFIICFTLLFIFMLARGCSSSGSADAEPRSTLERHPLSASACGEIDVWYEEHMSDRWINNTSVLKQGLEHFYDVTGVQPYVVIVESIPDVNGCPTDSEFTNYLKDVYDDVMPDGGHLVIGIFDNSGVVSGDYDWGFGCYAGKDAETVMDPEAREILLDHLERYYTDDSLTDEAFLARAISETGDKIMTVDKVQSSNVKTIVIVLSCVAVVALVVWFVIRRKKLRVEQAEADAEILGKDLGSSSDGDPLKDKYNVP